MPGATRSGHWSRIAERGSLLGLRILLVLYRYGGRVLFVPVVTCVVGYFAVTSSDARRASREFLSRVWQASAGCGGLTHRPTAWTSFLHFRSFAYAILDKLAAWQGEIRFDMIDHENLALFESRFRAGRGGIWITSHLGNIEVCRAINHQGGRYPLTVLMHTRHAGNFNRLLQEVAPESHLELLEVAEFGIEMALKLRQRIAQGRFIIIVGDRTPVTQAGRALDCPFLGRPASFPIGPFMLPALLDCPAGTLFCVREGSRYRLYIDDLPPLGGVPRASRDEAIAEAVRAYAARLEALCVRYPLQWFNFFPFWGDPNQGELVDESVI